MVKHEKRAYLVAIRNRYRRAKRTGQGKILDGFRSMLRVSCVRRLTSRGNTLE